MGFLKSCNECQLQKCKKSLRNTVTKPLHSPDLASRGQVDLIDMQTTSDVNRPYILLLVYQDNMTKCVVLRPIKRKTAEKVVNQLFDIFCLLVSPHILQSDNGREFKNVDLARMVRELWRGCRIVHRKPV